jgi:signal transduction histidine kinase
VTTTSERRHGRLAATIAAIVAVAGALPVLVTTGLLARGWASPGATRIAIVVSIVLACSVAAYVTVRSAHSRIEAEYDGLAKRQRELEADVRRVAASRASLEAAFIRFAHSVSHDLRAPVRALDGFSAILLEDYHNTLDEDGRDYLRRMRDAARRLDRLIGDLHAYARISSMPAGSHWVDVDRLVQELVGQFDTSVSAPGTTVDVARPLAAVRGDEILLREALAQLLANALKFTRAGAAARVRVRSVTSDDRVRVYVEDEGIGVPEEQRRRIFEVFERLHPDSEYQGTGIGLALVAKVVERLDGAAGVEPNVPEGSRFWVELPKG